MNYGLLVQTRPMPTIAGASVHPSQMRRWTERLTPVFAIVIQALRFNAPRR